MHISTLMAAECARYRWQGRFIGSFSRGTTQEISQLRKNARFLKVVNTFGLSLLCAPCCYEAQTFPSISRDRLTFYFVMRRHGSFVRMNNAIKTTGLGVTTFIFTREVHDSR